GVVGRSFLFPWLRRILNHGSLVRVRGLDVLLDWLLDRLLCGGLLRRRALGPDLRAGDAVVDVDRDAVTAVNSDHSVLVARQRDRLVDALDRLAILNRDVANGVPGEPLLVLILTHEADIVVIHVDADKHHTSP